MITRVFGKLNILQAKRFERMGLKAAAVAGDMAYTRNPQKVRVLEHEMCFLVNLKQELCTTPFLRRPRCVFELRLLSRSVVRLPALLM